MMNSVLDSSLCNELANHIETLTHSGQKTLDPTVVKKIKKICKLSDGYVEHGYRLILYQLEKQHAEIRFSAFQICNELFRRSHCFRELLVSNMQHIMELTAETSHVLHLPPPRAVALNLKRLALQTIQEWNREFGDGYKKLQLGYNFLKHCKKVDFNALEMENSAQRLRQQEIERRQNILNEKRLKRVSEEMAELQAEITNTLTAIENCIGLLLPSPDEFFIVDEKGMDDTMEEQCIPVDIFKTENKLDRGSDSDEEQNINFRAHGMLNPNFSIQLNIQPGTSTIKETSENTAIFENARDLHALITNRYLPCVKKWEQMVTKSSGSSDQLKKIIDLKRALESASKKYSKLNLKPSSMNENDSSDSDFEEVMEKEGYEETVQEDLPVLTAANSSATSTTVHKTGKEKDWSIWSKENNEKDPTSAQSTLVTLASVKPVVDKSSCDEKCSGTDKVITKEKTNHIEPDEPQPSTSNTNSRKSKLLAVAPKLPFDIDLYHWEDENITAPTMLTVKPEGARFWSATSNDDLEEIPVPDGSACLRTRVIEFSGSYEPVRWACRVPLPNGKLCPRRDRQKCPFHGLIVGRDETGQCSNPEEAAQLANLAEQKQRENPDWQDPKLLEEIKQATGIDLKMPEKRKGGKTKEKKNKHPGLTDLNVAQNTSYIRLSKKIFKRSAMKKVAQALDHADHKRFRDKYGDQFHYLHDTVLTEDVLKNQNNDDIKSQESDISGLQLMSSTLSADHENLLWVFLIRRLRKGAIYVGTGAFSGMDFSFNGSSPAVCYYILLPCHALVCLLSMAETNLEVFRPELANFCEQLAPHLKGPNISSQLASWHVVCLQYIGRVLQALGPQVASLLQLAQQNRVMKSTPDVPETLAADVQRFVSVCAVAECLGAQPGADAVLQSVGKTGKLCLDGVECNAYCMDWTRLLLEHGHSAEPWRLRKVLEAFKLKTIKDMNMLKRLLKLAETDHYSLYRAYSFLWQSGNSKVLLHQAALEGGSSPAVLAALQDHLSAMSAVSVL